MTTVETRTSGSIAWETRTGAREIRYNGKCRACKRHHSILVTRTSQRTYRSDMIKCVSSSTETVYAGKRLAFDTVTCCGKPVQIKAVKGTNNPEVKCGAKCLSSKGHICECSCGGKNHGAG